MNIVAESRRPAEERHEAPTSLHALHRRITKRVRGER